MSEPEPSGLRIGDAERNAAMAALDAHLQDGRLDANEYGERSARAATARTVDDLRPLFTDLPEPHAPQVSGSPTGHAALETTRPEGSDAPARVGGPAAPVPAGGSGTLARWGPRLSGALPLIAVVLFFTVPIPHAWIFFLLIPLGGALFAGSRRDDRDDGRNDR